MSSSSPLREQQRNVAILKLLRLSGHRKFIKLVELYNTRADNLHQIFEIIDGVLELMLKNFPWLQVNSPDGNKHPEYYHYYNDEDLADDIALYTNHPGSKYMWVHGIWRWHERVHGQTFGSRGNESNSLQQMAFHVFRPGQDVVAYNRRMQQRVLGSADPDFLKDPEVIDWRIITELSEFSFEWWLNLIQHVFSSKSNARDVASICKKAKTFFFLDEPPRVHRPPSPEIWTCNWTGQYFGDIVTFPRARPAAGSVGLAGGDQLQPPQ